MTGNYHKAEMIGVTTDIKKIVGSQGVKTSRELSHTDKISSRAFPQQTLNANDEFTKMITDMNLQGI